MSTHMFAQHIAVAACLGAIIGIEREWHQGMAGLRTNALVAVGAAAFVSLPVLLGEEGSGPAHMAAYIISGIGFLGAGVIMREGMNIRGLNTAATLWGTASTGAFAGSGLISEATVIMLGILVANLLMRPLSKLVGWARANLGDGGSTTYTIEVHCRAESRELARTSVLGKINRSGMLVHAMEIQEIKEKDLTIITEVFGKITQIGLSRIVGELAAEPAINSARWSILSMDKTG